MHTSDQRLLKTKRINEQKQRTEDDIEKDVKKWLDEKPNPADMEGLEPKGEFDCEKCKEHNTFCQTSGNAFRNIQKAVVQTAKCKNCGTVDKKALSKIVRNIYMDYLNKGLSSAMLG